MLEVPPPGVALLEIPLLGAVADGEVELLGRV
jgi:hypothetical protein